MKSKKLTGGKEISLNIAPVYAQELKNLRYLTKKQRASLNKYLIENIKILKSHFRQKDCGWPIDVRIIVNQIILKAFKIDLESFVKYSILKGLGKNFSIKQSVKHANRPVYIRIKKK